MRPHPLRPISSAPFDDAEALDQRAIGPQGDALILELQRLQSAFPDEQEPEPRGGRPSRDGRPKRRPTPPRTKSTPRPKNAKKGKMGRALDVCLKQFGFRDKPSRPAAPAQTQQRRPERMPEPELPRPPQRRRAPPAPLREDFAGHGEPLRPAATANRSPAAARPQIVRAAPVRREAPEPLPPRPEPPKIAAPRPMADELQIKLPAPAPMGQDQARRLASTMGTALSTGMAFIARQGTAADLDTPSDEGLASRVGRMFENELRTGLRILLLTTAVAGGWLVLMPLAGAVVVPGNLVVQSSVKAIQHPSGGIVAEIKVQNGMHVAAGDLLLRLDATQTQAGLRMVSKQLDEIRARIGRLIAERDGLERPQIHAELVERASEDMVVALLAAEDSLFKARFSARQSQKDLLQSRIAQLTQEITGVESQLAAKGKELELIAGELTGVQELYDKRLVPLTRLTTLQRESARIEGERGQLTSAIAETKSKIGEAQLQVVRLDQDFRTEVVKDLVEAQGKEAELVQRGVAAKDQLDRIELRAPTAGVIHQLSTHTIGGVIRAGDTVMEIVPDSDDLQIEAHVQPNEIDHVHTGQDAFVRLSAFNQRTTPQLNGKISFVSATTSHDQQSSANYYTVRISLTEDELHRLGGLQLIPGMPAEVFMQTGSRTMMSYLLKPITDQMRRAFVEN